MRFHTHSTCLRRLLAAALLLAFSAFQVAVLAQSAGALLEAPAAEKEVSAAQLEAGRKAVEADTTLEESRKQKTLSMFDQAAGWLQQAADSRAELARLASLVRQAPQRIEAIRSGTAQAEWKERDIDSVLASGNLAAIELAISEAQPKLQQARERLREYEDELARLLVGSKGLSEEIVAGLKAVEQIDADLAATAADEPPVLLKARTLTLKSRRMLRQAELDLSRLRLSSHDLLTNLAQAERDLAAGEITERQKSLERLNQVAQKLRESQAQQARQAADELKSATEVLPAPLRKIAEENARYRQELEQLVSREQSVNAELASARVDLDGIKSDYERTRQRVDVVGTSSAIGKMLKRRRQELPSLLSYRRNSEKRGLEISRAIDRQIDIEELLRERGDIGMVTASATTRLSEAERAEFTPRARGLARIRRDALNELQQVYGRYIGQITSLDNTKRQLVEVSEAFVRYISDQLVWIPGTSVMAAMQPEEFTKGLMWLFESQQLGLLVVDVWTLATKEPVRLLVMSLLFLLLLTGRRRSRMRLIEIADKTKRIRSDSFKLTSWALLHTLVIVGAWPLLMLGSGWLIGKLSAAAPLTDILANGAISAGVLLLGFRFFIQICLSDGLGDTHLRWPAPIRAAIVSGLNWALVPIVVLGFATAAALAGEQTPQAVSTLGHIAFILLMLLFAVIIYRLLRIKSALMSVLCSARAEKPGPLLQLHFVWFPLLLLVPLSLALISAVGYHNAALHLAIRSAETLLFFTGLFLLKELVLRYLYIAERRLRLEDALQRRNELRLQRAQESAPGDEDKLQSLPVVPEMNFDQLSEQNKRLVTTGFLFSAIVGVWSIWSDLLPALSFLNSTELPFHATRMIEGISKEVPVTLGDLTIGLIVVAITVLAAKNIPGVLEIALLQRLPLDPGARYAITSLTQYLIVGIGVLSAFSTMGLQWSSIQWLVAALSVGLGFGLQEIVANFISGIILLFERPIRVGDVVTIDNTTGKVARIRIRATTILNWDKQELLIPNKEFITGRVINWTLTDKINRVLIVVGVAYGTDVDRAMALMLEAARANENVLGDPEPVVSFDAFGDNALTLTLRAYLDSLDNRLATITALHRAVNERFDAAGINISFPQRDVHLDTTKPLDIRVHQVPADAPA